MATRISLCVGIDEEGINGLSLKLSLKLLLMMMMMMWLFLLMMMYSGRRQSGLEIRYSCVFGM